MNKQATATQHPGPARPGAPQLDGERKDVATTVRWAHVLPVDFDGEDTSLTQAQLTALK